MKLGSVTPLIAVPDGKDPVLYRVERAAELGLKVLVTRVDQHPRADDVGFLRELGQLAREKGVELHLRTIADFYQPGSAEADKAAAFNRVTAEATGARLSSCFCGPMLSTHRWTPGPPLEDRRRTVATNLRRMADGLKDVDVVMALENHCDWRSHEIRQIVEMVDRPNLRVQLDTGNAYAVFEDPIDCARQLAPYTASVHLKDVRVTPFATGEALGTRAVAVPLGEGHVDNVAIVKMLRNQAPDGADLSLLFEPFYLPEGWAPEDFLRQNIAWAQANLTEEIA